MNKKANLFDPLVIIIILFVFGISTVLFLLIGSELRDGINAKITLAESQNAMNKTYEALQLFDYTFVILLSMLIISSVISAFFIRSHPVYFFVSTIVLIVFVIPAAILSNVFDKFEHVDKFVAFADDFQIISYFMGKLPMIIVISGVLIMVALFINKPGAGDYYG
jgi:hypothetical protein